MTKQPSLRQILINEIMRKGYVSLEEIHILAKRENHKESNAERRLRASESPLIESVRNEKGFIQGYRYKLFNVTEQIKKAEEFAPRMRPLF